MLKNLSPPSKKYPFSKNTPTYGGECESKWWRWEGGHN